MGGFLGVTDYRDLVRKCIYDLDQLQANETNEEGYGFCLINLINTLNHLFDWVLNDPNLQDSVKIQCVQHFNPYSDSKQVNPDFRDVYARLGAFPPVNENQFLVRRLSNGLKHMNGKIKTERDDMPFRDIPRPALTGNPDPESDGWKYPKGDPRGSGWQHMYFYSVDDDSGIPHNVEDICSSLWEQWTLFPEWM